MKKMSDEDVLNNFNIWSNAVIISSITKNTTLNEISSKINVSKSSPYFYNLIGFLESNKFIVVDKERTPYSIKVKCNELAWFLRSGDVFSYSRELIKNSMGIKPYYYG